jgi:small subunit ribosomal protein S20
MADKKKTMRHRSGLKAHRQSLRRHQRNLEIKKAVRKTVRSAVAAATTKDAKAGDLLSQASSTLDRAAQRGTIHWKTAARKKSRLAKRVATQLAAVAAAPKA